MKEKLTSYQFLAIMFLLSSGTSSLFFIKPDLKNDIWIAMLFYALVSIIIQMIYISLFNKYPNNSIITYLPKIYGKYIGFILSISYIWFFTYDAARDLRDFNYLATSFALIRMPMSITDAVFMIVITYAVYKGIENIGSMAQIGFIIIIFSSILVFILLFFSEGTVFKFYNLSPILHEGFMPLVLKGWTLSIFPFGIFVIMPMLYPFLIQKTKLRKTIIFTSILSGVFLALNNILFIITLGYEFASATNYPLLETLRLVHMGDFLNRLDIIFIMVLILGGFFKIAVLMYASALGTSQVFKVKSWGGLCIILGVLITITALTIGKTYPEHISTGWNLMVPYIFPLFFYIIPLISLIIYYLKKMIKA